MNCKHLDQCSAYEVVVTQCPGLLTHAPALMWMVKRHGASVVLVTALKKGFGKWIEPRFLQPFIIENYG